MVHVCMYEGYVPDLALQKKFTMLYLYFRLDATTVSWDLAKPVLAEPRPGRPLLFQPQPQQIFLQQLTPGSSLPPQSCAGLPSDSEISLKKDKGNS
jgi:hypothetical protein